MKKYLVSIIIAVLGAACLAGCGLEKELTDVIESEVQEIISSIADENNSAADDGWFDSELDSWEDYIDETEPETTLAETKEETIAETKEDTTEQAQKLVYSLDTVSNGEEATIKGILNAVDENGNVVWSYETDSCYETELEVVQDIGETSYGYLIIAGGKIICLEKAGANGGSVKWTYELMGASVSFDFDEYENLYICGYYGPDLCVISPKGELLYQSTDLPDDYYWPYDLKVNSDRTVTISFYSNEETITINPWQ